MLLTWQSSHFPHVHFSCYIPRIPYFQFKWFIQMASCLKWMCFHMLIVFLFACDSYMITHFCWVILGVSHTFSVCFYTYIEQIFILRAKHRYQRINSIPSISKSIDSLKSFTFYCSNCDCSTNFQAKYSLAMFIVSYWKKCTHPNCWELWAKSLELKEVFFSYHIDV